jgi:FixJ family two-component response regulator
MLHIAIVDDDAAHSRAVARLLRACGVEASVFVSAEDYLARGEERPFDALVLDIQLGGMSGFELQRRLAAAGKGPPVVFLTAHEEPETLARASAAGCPLVRKTDPASVLLDAVRAEIDARSRFPKG